MIVCTYDLKQDKIHVVKIIRGLHLWKVDLYVQSPEQKIEKSIQNKVTTNLARMHDEIQNQLNDMIKELGEEDITAGGFTITLLR